MKKNQWLSVSDLIEILQTMPPDAKVIVENNEMFNAGCYYATRDSIELYKEGVDTDSSIISTENQVLIGTNYNTQAL